MKVLAGIFFLASLFSSRETFAQLCVNGANLTASATSICSGDSVRFTLTDIPGGTAVASWSANYQWQSSATGVGGWSNVGAPGTISSAGPVSATYTTPGLFANSYYQVVLTGIVGDCTVGTTTATSNVIGITVNPRPAAITGVTNICVGTIQCLTDASSGGTWNSDDATVATVAATGCVTGISGGTATIIYTLAGCSSISVVTVNTTANINGPSVVCQGSTITLTDATAGITWTSSNTGVATIDPSTGLVTGISGGTTIITATSPLSCNTTTVITVNPLPAGITGNTNICIGLINCLTDTDAGGTWSSSNSAVASVSATGCVTGSSVGNATITYTLPTGCLITTNLTVNPLPTPILGTDTLCQGSTTILTDATPGGTWTSSNPSIAPVTAGAGNVSGALGGTATITYTLPTGCIATVVVTVNPYGPINGNFNVCLGGTTTLTDAATGGVWSSSNPAIGSVDPVTGVVTGLTLGNFNIIYTLPFGCVATASLTVDPLPSAIGGPTSVCVGATITLNDLPTGGTWTSSTPTVAIIDPSTGVVTGISNGTTTITYTLPTGCTATTVIAVNPVAPITGPTSVCVGLGITLTDATPGGGWSSSNPGIASIDPFGNVTGLSAGTTIISYSLPSGCAATVVVTVNPLPATISGTLSVCEDGGVTCLTDATAGGVWSSTLVVIAPSGCATGYATGLGTVTYTPPTGCMTISNVTVNPLPAPITGNNTVCVGFTTALSDVSPGGTWSSVTAAVGTVGSSTGVVTGIATGSTEIIYTLPTGCTADTLVTVFPVPNTITGTLVVCQGSITSLTDVTSGGSWSSSTGAVATVDASGNVTGVSNGTSTITYTIPSGCFTTVVVTVNPLPAAITGPNTVCMGNTISLNDITGGGIWSSTFPAVGTVDVTGDVTGITAGTTTISYTINTGCAATLVVTVNSLFAITGNVEFCVGQSITLSDAAAGGTWSSVNPGIASVDAISGVVTGTGPAGGTTTIVYTLPTGCSANVIVTVNTSPLPITGITGVCAGLTTNLTDATVGGNWSSSTPTVAQVGATGIVTGITGGTAVITYQIGSSCIVTTIVTVYPFSRIIGNPNVCLGQTTSLTDATAGGTWGSINTGVATVDGSGNVTGVSVDTTTIYYSLPTGCEATVVVTVNPLSPITGGNTILCVGNTLTLNDATVGGIWTSSNTGIASVGSLTGIVTGGPGTGVVTITNTTPSGCVATTTITVNSLSAITGPTSVCMGSQITLNESTAGGVWSSSNPAVGSIDPLTGIVTGVSAGAVIITYTYGASCWVIYSVIVNPMSPVLGTLSLCPGLCTSLSDTTIGGVWSSSNTTIATIGSTTGLVCGVASGTAVITYTVPTGCSATAIVTVNTVLPLTGNPSICLGGTTTLTDAVAGGTWSSSNLAVATVDPLGNVTSAGTVGTSNITYTLPTGCVAVITVTVNPLPSPITGPNQVCAYGGTAQLSEATAGGTWSSFNPVISVTGVITGEVPGTGTVTYTLPTGCAVYYTITINPLPTAINGNLVICQGLSTTLSDLTNGGTWSTGNGSIATVGSISGIVTGIAPGTTMVTYTLASGCYVDTIITINPNPLPINGTLTVCVGLTTTLTDATGGGVWTSSNTAVATVGSSSGVVTGVGVAGGTATITYTLLTGCLNTVVVTVNPNPTAILGAGSVCVGQTICLTDATAGGTWSSSSAVAIVNSGTGCVTGLAAGTTIITYTLSTGCITTTIITVNPLSPITGTPSLCVGLTTNLTDATPGGTWSSNATGVATVGSTTGVVTGVTQGTATISYVMPSGCTSTIIVTVYALPTNISGTLSVCVGQTTSVSDGTAGGTWTSNNGNITIGSSSGIITGNIAGTSIITYTLGTGCTITAVVTVNPLAPITGATNLCQSQVTTVSDLVTGGVWSSSNTNVTVDAFGNVTANTVGTSTISYVLPTGCTTTLIVTVNSLAAIHGTTELCVGTSTVFTDSLLGGIWNSSNTGVATVNSITGIVTGVAPGTAIISYTLSSGCTATIIVTVAALSPITGPSSVCQGDSIALTDATPGGTWTSSFDSTATVSTTGEVIGHHSGTAIISYSYGPGCVAIHTVIVNPATPILGNLNVCLGLTTHLSDSTLGGTWSITPTTIAVINPSGTVTGIDAGTATVINTLPSGCIITAIVTVNVTNAIQGADSVCVGLTTALTDATAGVTWTSSTPSVASINSATGVVTGNAAGTTTITATSPLGCIATVVVTVNPLPSAILGTPVVCQGLTITLTDLTPLGTWSSSNTAVATVSAAGVVTGVLSGSTTSSTATITYTLPTSCITTVVVTVNPLPASITGNLVVCQGSTTDLSDITPGGTWSISPTTIATVDPFGVVTGVAGGTATVTYTLGTGCIITAIVTVNPLPNPISGNPNVCIGTTVCYTDGTPGGTWASSNPAVGSISAAGCVSGLTLGTTIITYDLTTTGCLVTVAVTVDPLPTPILGADSVCVGLTTQLTDATPGGTWTSSNTAIETIGLGTGLALGVSAGVVTDTYSLFSTGCFVTTTFTVNPTPLPITGNFSVCFGTCNTLADANPGGTWSSSNVVVAPIGSATGVVCGNVLGTATITYTLPTGCIITQVITVNPLPAPITGNTPICVGYSITLSDITPGGTWTSSLIDTASVIDTTGFVTGLHSGTSTITYTLTNTGCIATTVVTVNPIPDIITGRNTVCLHDSVMLSDANHGGSWTSLNPGIGSISPYGLSDSTAWIIGESAGGTVITYTMPTGCFITDSVTVFPLPPAITGPSVVCVNSFITLSDSSVGGTWSVNLVDTANINSVTGILVGVHSGTVLVTYTSNHGCTATKPVTVNPIPTPIYGIDRVCNGFSVALNDTSAGGIWSSSNIVIDTVNDTGLVTGFSPGTDTIFYTYPVTGCNVYTLFTVDPIPVITVVALPNAQICIGGSVILTASGASTPGGSAGTYVWAPPTALSSTAGNPVVASPTVTTTYTVIGTTQYGCSSDTTVTVHVDSMLLHIEITGRHSICAGDADTLIASGYTGSLFNWTPVTTGLSCTICDTTIARIVNTTTYTAVAIDTANCKYSASFTVSVNPLPILSVNPNPAIVCQGSTTQLTASGAATYTWFPNAFLNCDTCAIVIASDTQNLVYNVIGTTSFGCRDSILVPVSVLDTTQITISNDTIICLGQSVQLIATSTAGDGSHPEFYSWTPTTKLSDPNSPTPIATPDTTTQYSVTIKENFCFTRVENVTVYVEPQPTIIITASGTNVSAGTQVQLTASIANEVLVSDYIWTPADGLSCDRCFAPIATPTVTTTYTFTATSNYGCSSSADITISLFCDGSQVFIPNTFTPDGDGVNDRFFINAHGVSSIVRLSVYNRWGELVFQSLNSQPNDPGAGWDGTYKGMVLSPDVFMYVAEVICEIGQQPFSFKGDVSIVR